MYRLCYEERIIQEKDRKYIPVNIISDINSFCSAIDILHCLKKDADRIKYVESAYQEFLKQKKTMKKYTSNGQINLEIKARSFFMEFSIFHEHWRRHISHHPKSNELEKLFEQVTHTAFDSSNEYALATIIRNYEVHSADIINATIWGSTYYDVSVSRSEMLADDRISESKKEILKRQTSEYLTLEPIMESALIELRKIQKALIQFIVDQETRNAMDIAASGIRRIKEYGDKQWFFFEDDGQRFIAKDKDGRSIEYIEGKVLEFFLWKEFDELIVAVKEMCGL